MHRIHFPHITMRSGNHRPSTSMLFIIVIVLNFIKMLTNKIHTLPLIYIRSLAQCFHNFAHLIRSRTPFFAPLHHRADLSPHSSSLSFTPLPSECWSHYLSIYPPYSNICQHVNPFLWNHFHTNSRSFVHSPAHAHSHSPIIAGISGCIALEACTL